LGHGVENILPVHKESTTFAGKVWNLLEKADFCWTNQASLGKIHPVSENPFSILDYSN
jgi:hypothetical protein